MRRCVALLIVLLLSLCLTAATPDASIPYFRSQREVTVAAPDRQNYLVVDSALWSQARPDLADIRLYDGATQVPYQLVLERAVSSTDEIEAKILNLAQRGDHTEFDLDVAPVTEYNRIRLALDRKDFLITATVAGQDSLAGKTSPPWPSPSTLFDFSRESLGSNATIRLPLWTFRYVHVRLSPGILPKEVQQATVAYQQEKKAAWTDAGSCGMDGGLKRTTTFICDVPPAMPIDRIRFEVPSARVNFRRAVSVANEKGSQVAAGSISRIRMNRGGTTAVSEDLELNLVSEYTGRLTVTIDNGDDAPLAVEHVQPQSVQRRLYFESQGKTALKLYYGDEKLGTPVYDYGKFFHENPNAVEAKLGADAANPAYTSRPDERPWSERHKAVLWAALLIAVAVLAFLAVRGLKSDSGNPASGDHANP